MTVATRAVIASVASVVAQRASDVECELRYELARRDLPEGVVSVPRFEDLGGGSTVGAGTSEAVHDQTLAAALETLRQATGRSFMLIVDEGNDRSIVAHVGVFGKVTDSPAARAAYSMRFLLLCSEAALESAAQLASRSDL
jgi:hypothetical protein